MFKSLNRIIKNMVDTNTFKPMLIITKKMCIVLMKHDGSVTLIKMFWLSKKK